MGGDGIRREGPDREDLPAVLTPKEAARLLRVPRRTIYTWIDTGVLPSRRVGKRLLRVLRQDVQAILEQDPEWGSLGADTTLDGERSTGDA
jgi:excisionase family DNA binding protein